MHFQKRKLMIMGVLCTSIVLCCGAGHAADVLDSYAMDRLVDVFKTESGKWASYFQERAEWLFWTLACITLCYKGIMQAATGFKGDFGDVLNELVQFIISTGFFYYLLCEGPKLAEMLIDSFQQMGTTASANMSSVRLSPNGIVLVGLEIVVAALSKLSLMDLMQSFALVISALFLLVVYIFIAAKMCVMLIAAWVTAYAGLIYLGFGGSSITKDMAVNYIKGCLEMAIKVMVFCLIVGIGQTFIMQMGAKVLAAKTVTYDSYEYTLQTGLPDPRVETDLVTRNDLLVLLVLALMLLIIIQEVPDLVAGLVTRSHASTIASAITTGAAMHALSSASGGVGNAIAGASALQNAVKQTAAQSQAGEGIFRNSSGVGESTIRGSFAKVMGTDGMSKAAGYAGLAAMGVAKNLLAGGATAASQEASRTAMGQLDAGIQLNMAHDANKRNIDNLGGSGQVVTKDNVSQAQTPIGKIAGESASSVHSSDTQKMDSTSSVNEMAWETANSDRTMMQQSLGGIVENVQHIKPVNTESPMSPDVKSASSGEGKMAPPSEPPPLPDNV